MKIALLCSGLGTVNRGHEVFARSLFELLHDNVDLTLFKGGGEAAQREVLVPCVPRNSLLLRDVHVAGATRWADSIREQERSRIEHETFAYAAMGPLLAGGYDVIHCLEQEVCSVIYRNRHLFSRIPSVVFSNGGAIPAHDLPPCDHVQEHTEHNLRFSDRSRAFMIPHGVDLTRFRPGIASTFRAEHGIGTHERVVVSVGTIGVNHKRMDHVIRELTPLKDQFFLIIAGQESAETPSIKALALELLGNRVLFTTVSHQALPDLLAAADIFVLGSIFETFGIVYIEAMAMGLPVVCTEHPNQRLIVKEGVFIDMTKPGELTRVLRDTDASTWRQLGLKGREIAEREYGLQVLKSRYIETYSAIAAKAPLLPDPSIGKRLGHHTRNALRGLRNKLLGRAH